MSEVSKSEEKAAPAAKKATTTGKMSRSQTGHAVNAEHFRTLIDYVEGYGAAYAPPSDAVKLEALKALAASVTAEMNETAALEAPYNIAVAARAEAFMPMGKLATRVGGRVTSLGKKDTTVLNAVKKVRGDGNSAKAATDAEKHSTSEMDFASRLQNFKNMTSYLAASPWYVSHDDLAAAKLVSYAESLMPYMRNVDSAYNVLAKNRDERNKLLYGENGVIVRAAMVKAYVKSVFGASSNEYKQINSLTFRKPNQ